ncbi:hypothetical protein pb186bvf_002738 [Paramecium bursaria]
MNLIKTSDLAFCKKQNFQSRRSSHYLREELTQTKFKNTNINQQGKFFTKFQHQIKSYNLYYHFTHHILFFLIVQIIYNIQYYSQYNYMIKKGNGFHEPKKQGQNFPKIDDFGIGEIKEQINKFVKSTEIGNTFIELCLVRHQFTEIIFRVARYLNTSFSQCIKKVFPFILEVECAQDWRDKRYWTQIMDLTIQPKLPLLKALFLLTHSFTFKKSIRPEKFIILQDFKDLFFLSDLLEKNVQEQEMQLIFLQSMQLQPDELNSAEHFEMTFIEFVEALARMAEQISPISPTFKVQDLNQEERTTLPLYVKFEGLLYILFHRLKSRLTRLSFGGLEKTCVEKTIIKSKLLKQLGINTKNLTSSDKESDTEDLFNPEDLIFDLLKYEQKFSKPRQSKPTLEFKIKPMKVTDATQSTTSNGSKASNKWGIIRKVFIPKIIRPMNIIGHVKQSQELFSQQFMENSSPLTKLKFKKRRETIQEADFQINDSKMNQYDYIEEKQIKKLIYRYKLDSMVYCISNLGK